MKNKYYVAVYEWPDDHTKISGISFGTLLYCTVEELYKHEPRCVGYFETEVSILTKNEFHEKHGIPICGAV